MQYDASHWRHSVTASQLDVNNLHLLYSQNSEISFNKIFVESNKKSN